MTTDPLHDLAIEENILSGCMQSDTALWQALSLDLESEDFYVEKHRIIWSAMYDIGHDGDGKASELQIVQWLREQKQLASVGGAAAVSRIGDIMPAFASLPGHIEILKGMKRGRDIRHMCMDVLQSDTVEEQTKALEEGFSSLMAAAHERHTTTVAEAAEHFKVEDLGDAVEYDLFPRLNDKVRMRRGSLVVLAGSPGAGKTSLALQIAASISRNNPVLVASAEMRMREIIERYVAMITGFGPASLQCPTPAHKKKIEEAAALLKQYTNVTVMEPGFLTPSKVAGRARVEAIKSGQLGLVVVDYLQLFTLPKAGRMNREQVVGEMARQFKEMAHGLDVPILLLSQLSRDHKKTKRPPNMHDLRESGAIEAHADAIIMLDRDEESGDEETIVYIRKNRHGIRGRGRLKFCNGAKFEEYEAFAE